MPCSFSAFCVGGLLALGVNSGLAATSLDFTPIAREVKADGATRKIVFFRSAHVGFGRLSLVEYAPPWPITGHPDAAIMSVPGRDATVTLRSVETPDPLDLEESEAVVEWVKKLLPPGATGIRVEQVAKDPLRLNSNSTIEVTATCSLYGRSLQLSYFLCRRRGHRPQEVFVFQVASSPANFKPAHDAFLASLYSVVGF